MELSAKDKTAVLTLGPHFTMAPDTGSRYRLQIKDNVCCGWVAPVVPGAVPVKPVPPLVVPVAFPVEKGSSASEAPSTASAPRHIVGVWTSGLWDVLSYYVCLVSGVWTLGLWDVLSTMCVAGLYDKCLAAAHCQILLSICIQEFVIITNITVITNIIITVITNITLITL